MKLSMRAVVLGLTLALSATPVFAQSFFFTADENGNGTYSVGPPSLFNSPLSTEIIPDPTGGVAGNVLVYVLPFAVTPGDVELMEPGQSTPTASDLIRFYTPIASRPGFMIFYSDKDGPPLDLADTGLPSSPNAIQIPEVGPEGNNGAMWNPTPGQPGSPLAPMAGIDMYNFISDAPEPGAMLLMLAGAGGLALVRRFRR